MFTTRPTAPGNSTPTLSPPHRRASSSPTATFALAGTWSNEPLARFRVARSPPSEDGSCAPKKHRQKLRLRGIGPMIFNGLPATRELGPVEAEQTAPKRAVEFLEILLAGHDSKTHLQISEIREDHAHLVRLAKITVAGCDFVTVSLIDPDGVVLRRHNWTFSASGGKEPSTTWRSCSTVASSKVWGVRAAPVPCWPALAGPSEGLDHVRRISGVSPASWRLIRDDMAVLVKHDQRKYHAFQFALPLGGSEVDRAGRALEIALAASDAVRRNRLLLRYKRQPVLQNREHRVRYPKSRSYAPASLRQP